MLALVEKVESTEGVLGNLADLETDHKADIIAAVNEIFDIIETSELVVALNKPSAELKAIYEECQARPQIAKNIVFYNESDNMYYKVNGYKVESNAVRLQAIMGSGSNIYPVNLILSSNGILSAQ